MASEYWGMSLDDMAERIYEIPSDAVGGHYIAFAGTHEEARAKMIAAFTAFIDQHLYRATSYGSEWREGDDEDEEAL